MKDILKIGGAIGTRLIEARAGLAAQEETGPLVFQHSLLCQVGLPRSRQAGRIFAELFVAAAYVDDGGA